jgi:type I restriction enzyme M protein
LLNSDTKRHIDAARDVLVGVAPNPTTQIDQITYALIYKFMDDMDQASLKAGGEASFFVGDLEKYAWSNLTSTRIGNQEKMDLYSEALSKFSLANQLPELFRTIFRAASLPYRSPETLGLFLKEISFFDYTHPEELGNAYEYLLSIMSSQGDAGQFRTPRHIIDFIVDVINPTKDDKVLDPACGTGGFLVSTYNHILEQHDGKDDPKSREKPLTPDERKKLMSNLHGYDIDPTMVRIAQVNMYLHQFKNPQIFQYDSLTSEERWNDKYDVILANPPFMTPKGGIKPHNKFGVASNRAEVLFVDYIINHLKPKGRAGIVVPEGIVFQSGKAYKELRKNLVENGLFAVISLPGGVFQPYSGVKTSILLINSEIAKQKPDIAFIKISADGFDLGATKRVVTRNDLPLAVELLKTWSAGNSVENLIITQVSKDEIASNGDYNLSGDRYKVGIDHSNSRWPIVKLGDVADVISGQSPEGKFYNDTREGLPFYQGKTEFGERYIGRPKKWTTQVTKTAEAEDILLSVRAPVGPVNIASETICIGRGLAAIRAKSASQKFLFHVLKSMETTITGNGGAVFDSISRTQIEEIEIPLPPIEIQEEIVAELDGYTAIISGATQIVKNWKPRIDLKPEWPMVALSEVSIVEWGNTKLTKSSYVENGPFLGVSATGGDGRMDHFEHEVGTIVLSAIGANSGKVFYPNEKFTAIKNTMTISPRSEVIDSRFLYATLCANNLPRREVDLVFMTKGDVLEYKIALPSMAEQVEIVSSIEEESSQVDSAQRLIHTYEERIKKTIAKLWNSPQEVK